MGIEQAEYFGGAALPVGFRRQFVVHIRGEAVEVVIAVLAGDIRSDLQGSGVLEFDYGAGNGFIVFIRDDTADRALRGGFGLFCTVLREGENRQREYEE